MMRVHHPGVLEATVVAAELHELCRDTLSKYKVPDEIVFIDALPKNPVGKIDKPTLRTRVTDLARARR